MIKTSNGNLNVMQIVWLAVFLQMPPGWVEIHHVYASEGRPGLLWGSFRKGEFLCPVSLTIHPSDQVKYYVTGTLDESVQTILEGGGGAKKTAYLSGINTHCIVGSDPDYNEVNTHWLCLNLYYPFVYGTWFNHMLKCVINIIEIFIFSQKNRI